MADKILCVFQLIPEDTKAYVLDASSEIGQLAIASAGQYINAVRTADDDTIHQLSKLLADVADVDPEKPIDGPFSKVVICGFIM